MNSLVIPFCHAKNLANHYKSHVFLCFQFFFSLHLLSPSANNIKVF